MSTSEYARLKDKFEATNKRKREENYAVSKVSRAGKSAPRRLYSARTKEWYEMCRSLMKEENMRKGILDGVDGGDDRSAATILGRYDLCRWLMTALIGPNTHNKVESVPTTTPELYACPNAADEHRRLYDLLGHAIGARDPSLVSMTFLAIREKQPNSELADVPVPEALAKRLMQTSDHAGCVLEFLMLWVRRPRLVRWFLKTDLVAEHARSNHGFTDDLSAMAAAINDCVFNPQRKLPYEESKAKWVERHTTSSGSQHSSDTTCSSKGWRAVITDIMTLVGARLPERIYEDTKRDGERANRFGPVSLLVLGIRSFEIDGIFLKQALRHKKWSESQLSEAMIAALASEEGVRGPQFVEALVLLYHHLLECWKTNENTLKRGIVCQDDSIAGIWRILADKASGYEQVEVGGEQGKGIVEMPVAGERAHLLKKLPNDEDALMRHPQEWETLFEHMIRAHANDPKDANSHLWDIESPFFASLVRQAILHVMGDAKRTRLLGFLMKATDGCALVGSPPEHGVERVYKDRKLWSWLNHPSLVGQVCLHHVSLLPYLIDKMSFKTTEDTKTPLPECVQELQLGLWLSVINTKRQAARLLIGALKDGNMPLVAEAGSWGGEADCAIPWICFYVKELCEGADQVSRDQHGDDYADFLNARINADFKAVLAASDWDKSDLDEALRFASTYNRPIAAAVLMSPPTLCIPDTNDAFLMTINAEIHAPGNVAAEVTATNFETAVITNEGTTEAAEA